FQYGIDGVSGGLIGDTLSIIGLNFFGLIGSYVISITLMIVAFVLLTQISIVRVLKYFKQRVCDTIAFLLSKFKIQKKTKYSNLDMAQEVVLNLNNSYAEASEYTTSEQTSEKIRTLDFKRDPLEGKIVNLEEAGKKLRKQQVNNESDSSPINILIGNSPSLNDSYRLPTVDLLDAVIVLNTKKDKKEVVNKARILEETLGNFGVEAKVIQISQGPTITRYEIQPSSGVKVSRIVALADDIALNLAATNIRIEAPIPGKAAVGIEIPNDNISTLSLREVLQSDQFISSDSKLTFVLGKDIAGNPITADLAKMPHLLIAGATGSGKSVCVNTLISSILFKASPKEVKLLLIDPKVVELSNYNGIPHLLIPVVTDPKKASSALNWAVQEMSNRYKLFASKNVRDINSYNEKIQKENLETIPKIIIIIDELADLMMVAPGQVEDAICRLAQMARAAGMHLIVATQRPSVDVITGVIKANIPSRIAFAVSSQIDSRTIIDMGGAEKLLGKGDMLFYPVGASKPKRVQGAFISDADVEKIIKYIKDQSSENNYENEIVESLENSYKESESVVDELLEQAIDLVVQSEQASVSMLQRRFRIGYNRAARLMDEMTERGIVGEHEGSKPRQVLLSKEGLEEKKSRI
ncbi:MAG: DUF87 domain-containing protein, partial [Alkaliphilus sp.]|nr:DUF87 domain-containing protein [Alkaliphilus sp.]